MEDAVNPYLESQIMTATPQKLRLMLIDGAIRFSRQTVELWGQGQNDPALEALIRSRSIVAELLSGIRVEQSDLTRKVAGVYTFLFRNLTEAQLKRDANLVEDVIRVLEIERETWQLVCEKMPTAPVPSEGMLGTLGAPVEVLAPAEGIGGPERGAVSFDA